MKLRLIHRVYQIRVGALVAAVMLLLPARTGIHDVKDLMSPDSNRL
jgi:hypothetical protein